MVGRLDFHPLLQARADAGQRNPKAACSLEEIRNQLVERALRRERLLGRILSDVDAAAVTEFDPSFAVEFSVGGADGVGMEAEASRQFSRAGQTFAGSKVAAQYSEGDLGFNLLSDGNGAAASEPEVHEGYVNSGSVFGRRSRRKLGHPALGVAQFPRYC